MESRFTLKKKTENNILYHCHWGIYPLEIKGPDKKKWNNTNDYANGMINTIQFTKNKTKQQT